VSMMSDMIVSLSTTSKSGGGVEECEEGSACSGFGIVEVGVV